jgi:hypothetical protein
VTAASRHTDLFLLGKPCSVFLAHSLRFSIRMSLTYNFFIPCFVSTHSDNISPSLFSPDQCGTYFVGVVDGTGTRSIKIAITADTLTVRSLIYQASSQAFGSNQLTQPHFRFRIVP